MNQSEANNQTTDKQATEATELQPNAVPAQKERTNEGVHIANDLSSLYSLYEQSNMMKGLKPQSIAN